VIFQNVGAQSDAGRIQITFGNPTPQE